MVTRSEPVWRREWFQVSLGLMVLLTVAALVVPTVLGLIYAVRSVLVPVLIGLGLAYICNPLIRWMQRRLKFPRWAGVTTVLLTATTLVLLVAAVIVPRLVAQAGLLINNLQRVYPEAVEVLFAEAEGDDGAAWTQPGEAVAEGAVDTQTQTVEGVLDASVNAGGDPVHGHFWADWDAATVKLKVRELAQELAHIEPGQVVAFVLDWLDVGVGFIGSAISLTSYLALAGVVVVFCFAYFAWQFEAFVGWFVPLIPLKHRVRTLEVVGKMDRSVSAFVRGRLIQAAVIAVVLSVGWLITGVPYWLLLGIAGGMLNLIPYAAVVAWPIAVGLAILDQVSGPGDGSFSVFWAVVAPSVVYFLAQGLDGWVVEPVVQGRATNLDPLTVLVVVLTGGALAGLLGLILAIPAAACIKILAQELLLPRMRAWAAGEAGEAGMVAVDAGEHGHATRSGPQAASHNHEPLQ